MRLSPYLTVEFDQKPRKNCKIKKQEDFFKDDCKCPIPCAELIYTPSISYSALSDLKLQQLLLDPSSQEIKRKFNHAREVKERVMKRNRFFDKMLIKKSVKQKRKKGKKRERRREK